MNLTANKRIQTRIGISSYSYTYRIGFPGFKPQSPMTPFDLVDKAAELGVNIVQIADNCPLDMLSVNKLEELYRYAKERDIDIEVGTRGIDTENLLKYINISKLLHSSILRVVIDTPYHQPDIDEVVSLIRGVLPDLEQAGIVLGIENHDRFKASVFSEMMQRLSSPYVGIVLDTVNSFACQENTEQVLDVLARYCVNFHCKDFTIQRVENKMGLLVTGTIAGEGMLNVPNVWQNLLVNAPRNFSTILELWMAPKSTVEETLQQEDYWVKQSIVYLKNALQNSNLK